MKIIEKSSGKIIAIIEDDVIRILDAKNYKLVEEKNESKKTIAEALNGE